MLAFEAWKEQHGVSYPDAVEEERRLRAFRETLEMVTAHNERQDARLGSREGGYTLELNRFADMSWCVELYSSRRRGRRLIGC